MIVNNYHKPKSSFLSMEKDLDTILKLFIDNKVLQKLLYYTTKDSLDKPFLNKEQLYEVLSKSIKTVPKLYIDGSVLCYIGISFDDFTTNATNPEFRDSIIYFNIVCHHDQWQLSQSQLRPYRIAAEIDTMLNQKRLSGLGTLNFYGAFKVNYNDEFAGVTLMYRAIHGEEDKLITEKPKVKEALQANFNDMWND